MIQAPFFIARPGPAKVRHHAGVNRAKGRRPISSCVYSRLATSDFAGGTEPRGVPLIVAPGHRDCGAVAAAVHGDRTAEPPVCLTDTIRPAVMATRGKPGDPVNGAVRASVSDSADLRRDYQPKLHPATKSGAIRTVGVGYNRATGALAGWSTSWLWFPPSSIAASMEGER